MKELKKLTKQEFLILRDVCMAIVIRNVELINEHEEGLQAYLEKKPELTHGERVDYLLGASKNIGQRDALNWVVEHILGLMGDDITLRELDKLIEDLKSD